MSEHRRLAAPLTIGLLSLSLLTACQARMSHIPTIFQIARDGAELSGTNLVFPARQSRQGELTLSIGGLGLTPAAQRRLLAVLADVSYVTITVQDAAGARYTRMVDKNFMTGGKATATFSGLAPGQATVTVHAYDAVSKVIGEAQSTATVTAGQTTSVTMSVLLDPNYIAPAGGTAGTGTTTTGTVNVDAMVVDGPTVFGSPQPAPAHTSSGPQIHRSRWNLGGAAVAPNGHIFAHISNAHAVVEFAPGGTVELRLYGPLTVDNPDGTPMAFDAQSNLWIGSKDIRKHDSNLMVLAFASISETPLGEILTDSTGNAWASGAWMHAPKTVFKVAPDGRTVTPITHNDSVLRDIALDSQEQLWATSLDTSNDMLRSSLVQFAPDGTLLKEIAVSTEPSTGHSYKSLAIDQAGRIWFSRLNDQTLYVITQDSVPVMSVPCPGPIGDLLVDRQGHIWVYGTNIVAEFDATGSLLQTFDFGFDWIGRLLDTPTGMVGLPNGKNELIYFNP